MPKAPPFSQIQDGLPLWVVDVDDPQAALQQPADLHLQRLSLPGGEVLALALRIYDVARKPHLHHLAGPLDRPEVAAWTQALLQSGQVALVLQRSGWASTTERKVAVPAAELATLSVPPAPGQDPEGAIRLYLDRYHAEFPRLHQPEAVWDLIANPPVPVARQKTPWAWIVLALLGAGAAAWFLL